MKVFQAGDKWEGGEDLDAPSPMTVGDIIDRAATLYRRHSRELLPLVLIPSLFSFTGATLFTIGAGHFRLDGGAPLLLMVLGGTLYVVGKGSFYALLGGASRTFFDQFFAGVPFERGPVYQILRRRWQALMGAFLLVLVVAAGVLIGGYLLTVIGLVLIAALWSAWAVTLSATPPPEVTTGIGILLIGLVLWLCLVLYSRLLYVPQVLLVEGSSVFRAVGRSLRLAQGQSRRIALLLAFWIYAAWALWILLMVPVGWVAFWWGVEVDLLRTLDPFSIEGPLWYRIAQQAATQISELFVAPLAMLGLTLLYLDTRVRREGFDIQVLANRHLPLADPPAEGGEEVREERER
jgi:hypothetical protein